MASCSTAAVNPPPGVRAIMMAGGGGELVGALGALLERLLAVALEHQVSSSPNVDLRYHAAKLHEHKSIKV